MDPVYAVVFETLMLVCFGLSWPFNIVKSWKSRTAKGKSLIFELFVASGYCFGIAGKLLLNNITYVLIVYVLDLAMVSIDILLTLRNMLLDRRAEKKAAKAEQQRQEQQLQLQQKVEQLEQSAQEAAVTPPAAETPKEETV